MDESQALEAFSALSEPTRLKMLRFLVACGPNGAAAGEIAKAAGSSASRSSFHLSALTQAGLLTVERQSRQMIYRVEFDTIAHLVAFLLEDCCNNHPTVRACCSQKNL